MKWALPLAFVVLLALALYGWAEHGKRRDADIRADSALADYSRLARDSASQAAREVLADAEADALARHAATVERAARDSLAVVRRLLATLDATADASLGKAQTVRDSMVAYRQAYTAQRAATGRLLAAAALVTDSLLGLKDQSIANRQAEIDAARADRDRWKASADRLAHSVTELRGGRKIFGFIPKPSKLVAGLAGCLVGGLLDANDRARGCGLGGVALAVAAPTTN